MVRGYCRYRVFLCPLLAYEHTDRGQSQECAIGQEVFASRIPKKVKVAGKK